MSHFFCITALCFLTSGLTDHDVTVFTLSPVIKALHFDIVGGLRLEMSNHVPVFYTWEGRKKGGQRWEITSSTSKCWHNLFKLTASFSLPIVLRFRLLTQVMFFPSLSASHPNLVSFSDSLTRTQTVALFETSSIYGSFMFVLACLQYSHSTLTPLLHYYTLSHYYVLWNHRWDSYSLQHGNATFPTNEAEISCCTCHVSFHNKYNKSLHMYYLCPEVILVGTRF